MAFIPLKGFQFTYQNVNMEEGKNIFAKLGNQFV